MIPWSTFRNKIKDVKPQDLIGFVKLFVALPVSFFFRKRHPDLWLICEDEFEARDNGYWLFKYETERHPEQDVAYAIHPKSPDYDKVASLGKVIPYGSVKHWVYYLAASKNISSQKSGKPNAAVCYLLEISGILKNKRVFLQHGITKDNAKWIYYPVTKFSLFVCGAKPEYDYVKSVFGYPKGTVQYLGFPRFDNLHNVITQDNLVLIMPTWRNWFVQRSKNEDGKIPDVAASEYCKCWNSLLQDTAFLALLEQQDLQVIFFPHRLMQNWIHLFESSHERVKIARREDYDVQTLLRKAGCLITDYSSVFFDIAYMKKPVLFYQFDEEQYREKQLQQGYFDYSRTSFGTKYSNKDDLIRGLEEVVSKPRVTTPEFDAEHQLFFPLYDTDNCKRVHEAICKI